MIWEAKVIEVGKNKFIEYLNLITFKEHGDVYEKKYGHLISQKFPNCEVFWRKVVVPSTKRIERYPNGFVEDINHRDNIAEEIKKISRANYSIFLNLVFAKNHINIKNICYLEDVYVHLATVCDLVETVIISWYLMGLKFKRKRSKLLEELTIEEFLVEATKWYDENYKNNYEHYLSKGKPSPMRLPQTKNLVKEYLGNTPVGIEYLRHAQAIRTFRNVIVHDVKIARTVTLAGKILIPKPDKISTYRDWDNVYKGINNPETLRSDFEEINTQIEFDLSSLMEKIDTIWKKILEDFEDEFYSEERGELRKMYNISLKEELSLTASIQNMSKDVQPPIQPSGVYPKPYMGGTANIWVTDDTDDQDE